ncbi:SNF2 family N-terminal domain-containing protein [Suillus discolor]|uniref:SNF2 family N-terminal domain-containing protein n=1 Tax=Suillus discolor TaxID=1912936 RepID=A0A9P7FHA4_9AGAM|nr:SNF2 family N-terminal domain-containing protein [Suillus discolor]KAG2117059.1 SNF2 family N-terminal domain-containing protein [Suillus discolor]
MGDISKSTQKSTSRVLAALDYSMPSSSSSSHTTIQTSQILGKRKSESDTFPVSPVMRARTLPDIDSMIHGPHSSLNRPVHATGASSQGASSRAGKSKPRTKNNIQSKLITSGFSLRYDSETPASRIDQGGPDQEQRLAEFVYNSIENLGDRRSVKDAIRNLGLQSDKDLLPGLEVRLLPHQLIGVDWMVDQERKSPHRGGILADEMGLGKTVQMIATMAANLPRDTDAVKTTLVVVPAALLQQASLFSWKEEIETKSNDLFTVHIHHGRDKLSTLMDVRSKDVIITTYQTLSTELTIPKDIEEGKELAYLEDHGGVLGRMRWYRVILDEAQFIRNRGTHASRSVALLRSTYRWMLTGTPVTNTLYPTSPSADIYGLIRFGRFRPWNDWESFKQYIAKVQQEDAPLAAMRAQEILKPLLLRRTKQARLEGKLILQLPPKNIELVTLEFSADEQQLYDDFEKKSHVQINRFIRKGTLLKNATYILAMILRLRQLCCHPNLILARLLFFDYIGELTHPTGKEFARAIRVMGPAWVGDIKKRFMTRALESNLLVFSDEEGADATCPVCKDLYVNNAGRVLTCGHEICFGQWTLIMPSLSCFDRGLVSLDCMLMLSNSPITHNGEFGHGNEKENIRAEREYEAAAAKGHRPCAYSSFLRHAVLSLIRAGPTCKKMNDLSPTKVFKSIAFEPEEDEVEEANRARKHARRLVLEKPVRQGTVSSEESSDSDSEIELSVPSRFRGATPEVDSSDDDMPDFSQLFANGGKLKKKDKKATGNKRSRQQSDNDEVIDLTVSDVSDNLDGSDIKLGRRHAVRSSKKHYDNGKGKAPARDDEEKPSSQSAEKTNLEGPGAPSDALIAMWRKGDYDLEPSTKMLALISFLKSWDESGDKTICYSQWTSMLDLIETLFSRYGIRSLRYDGSMNRISRDNTLATFKRPDGPKVILISTKCGSVGLNLVVANRIINLDLSWNYASESQAYDRVHRLGQEKDVFVKRLVVKNTIEERMLRLQEVKTDLADAALGEGAGTKLQKMSVKEIKTLFGMKT